MNRLERRLQERRTRIGRRLRDAREAKGLSQAELGQLVGCSRSHVSQIESAKGTYSFRVFLAVCDALEADPAFVFGGVPAADLDALHLEFEKAIAELGPEAVDFLLSLDPSEIQLLVARSVEAIPHRRSEKPR